jgi:hypothetical protein
MISSSSLAPPNPDLLPPFTGTFSKTPSLRNTHTRSSQFLDLIIINMVKLLLIVAKKENAMMMLADLSTARVWGKGR